MDAEQIKDGIRNIIAQFSQSSIIQAIGEKEDFFLAGAISSFEAISALAVIEDSFDLTFTPGQMSGEQIRTIAGLAELILTNQRTSD